MIDRIDEAGGAVRIWAHPRADRALCGVCGTGSWRIHSRYERRLVDAAVAARRVEIRLRVRRFFCDDGRCPARTFAEQVPGLTVRHARRSPLCRRMLESIGLALAGRAGARMAGTLGFPTSRSTLLRLIRALPDPEIGLVRVLGVDDFALRRGHVYATVLIDMATHRPIDVLEDREADTLTAWLLAHPGTKVICRDRAGAYAEAASSGAPEAIQIADRWHLWHNLAEKVDKTVAAHHGCLRLSATATDDTAPGDTRPGPGTDVAADHGAAAISAQNYYGSSVLIERTRARYEAVHALRAQGETITAIVAQLQLARGTVRRFIRAKDVEELIAAPRAGRPSGIDDYKPYLHERWNAGVTNASALHREIVEQGYRGRQVTVAAYLAPFRTLTSAPPVAAIVPKVRHVVSWMLRHPDDLNDEQQLHLKQARASCPELDATAAHVSAFATMLTGRHGERLDRWMTDVEADNLPHLHRFVTGLRRDHAAVLNGLTLTHSSGAVEGNVNRIKMIKRQMYGRAAFDLLRKRILLAR